MRRWLLAAALLLVLGGFAYAASVPAPDGLLGLTYQEVYAKFGEPTYADFLILDEASPEPVYQRIALSEWSSVGQNPKLKGQQGSDVFVLNRNGVEVTYRLDYYPYIGEARWTAEWRVGRYAVEFASPVSLREAKAVVPEMAFLTDPAAKIRFKPKTEWSPPTLQGKLGDRADYGDVTSFLCRGEEEYWYLAAWFTLGPSLPVETVTGDTKITKVEFGLGRDWGGQDFPEIPNPLV